MSMQLTIVGCSGSYPGPDSAASCYLVQAEGPDGAGGTRTWNLVLDMGNGALGQLQRYVDPLAVDALLLSHLHADHCIDLTSYYVLRKYHPTGSQPRLAIHGPSGTMRRLAKAYDLPKDPGMREEFRFRRLERPFEVGPFRIKPLHVDHPVPAYGFRIQVGDATLCYSGDTGPTRNLNRLAEGVDLFLCEASFRECDDNPPSLHLTGKQAGDCATDAGVKQLVLTHIPPWHDPQVMLDEAVEAYAGPVELAVPGAVYKLG